MSHESVQPTNKIDARPAHVPYEAYPEEHARRVVTVRRTSGELDAGWMIDGEITDDHGNERYALIKLREDGAPMEKRVLKSQVDQLQAELFEKRKSAPKIAAGLSHVAVGPNVVIDMPDRAAMSADDKSERGWAVLHDEIEADAAKAHEVDPTLERQKKLFAPISSDGKDRYGGSFRERTAVTEESERDAIMAGVYAKNDDAMYELFQKYKGDSWRDNDKPALVRENEQLRLELGQHLLKRLDELNWLPERVAINSPDKTKSPNFPGYGDLTLTSREYAAMLALSMLDGTYKAGRSAHDYIEKNDYGEVIRGQHRYAAHMALGTEHMAKIHRVK